MLFFLYGTGANGKSVFVNTLVGIWNDYALTIGTDMLMVSTTDRHPTEIARLRGARLVVGNEVEAGRSWAESKIKALTGGDRLQGRFMRQDFFEFDPQFKLMVDRQQQAVAARRRRGHPPPAAPDPVHRHDPARRARPGAVRKAPSRMAGDPALGPRRVPDLAT